jgi:hypothetical protein
LSYLQENNVNKLRPSDEKHEDIGSKKEKAKTRLSSDQLSNGGGPAVKESKQSNGWFFSSVY